MVKKTKDKLVLTALAGSLLFNAGCATYKTMSPDLIQPVTPIARPIKQLKEPIDYGKLTWQEAIKYVQTPEQAQDYLDRHFRPDFDEAFGPERNKIGESFKYNHSRAKGLCLDYATIAAALLSDDGYPPFLLVVRTSDDSSKHAVYLYRTKAGYGALGQFSLKPLPSLDKLIYSIRGKYLSEYDKYMIVNLDKNFPRQEWISGEVNLQAVSFIDEWTKLK